MTPMMPSGLQSLIHLSPCPHPLTSKPLTGHRYGKYQGYAHWYEMCQGTGRDSWGHFAVRCARIQQHPGDPTLSG